MQPSFWARGRQRTVRRGHTALLLFQECIVLHLCSVRCSHGIGGVSWAPQTSCRPIIGTPNKHGSPACVHGNGYACHPCSRIDPSRTLTVDCETLHSERFLTYSPHAQIRHEHRAHGQQVVRRHTLPQQMHCTATKWWSCVKMACFLRGQEGLGCIRCTIYLAA